MPSSNEYKNRVPELKDIPWEEDPTQKITQYPDGTIERMITMDGHVTRQRFHASGAYEEWRNDGTSVSFAANNHLSYQKGGFTLSIDNNGDIKIAGHGRVNIDHDAHIEVAKNASIAVNGMADIYAKGHVKFAAADIALQSTQGSIVLNAARDIELRADKGRITGHSSGVTTFTTDSGDFHVDSAGEIDLTSALDTNVNSSGKINTQSSSDTNIQSSADVTTKANGTNSVQVGEASGMRVQNGLVVITKKTFVGMLDLKDQLAPVLVPKAQFPGG